MFGFFGNKKAKLEHRYNRLMEEAYRLSHTDRKASDQKHAEAAQVMEQIEALERDKTQGKSPA
ncbi:Lacal_2735 family protein [Botrimarina sp.]|uniref:Lacal_2735 family protein n=1 Tax=Botrimarina sp. TaxID=2795802 RepID=UPI0032EAFC48